MDDELERYIIANCRQYFLKEEHQALMRLSVLEEGKLSFEKSSLAEWKIEQIYGFQNPKTNELVALGGNGASKQIAQRIYDNHKHDILNQCPICGKLARTPEAEQCRHCGHDWH